MRDGPVPGYLVVLDALCGGNEAGVKDRGFGALLDELLPPSISPFIALHVFPREPWPELLENRIETLDLILGLLEVGLNAF